MSKKHIKLKEKSKNEKITKHQFYFETALYKKVDCEDPDSELFRGDVDAYNSMDGFDTTYSIYTSRADSYSWNGFKKINLECKRGGQTNLKFFVVIFDGDTIMKVGQYPSLANIQLAEIGKKYSCYLSEEDLENYKKAIESYARGTGAGSFVYLRRIFENLISETYREHKTDIKNINENEFRKKKMKEKIKILKDFLPSQLLELKSIYKILSKGVHKLSEKECLIYFSPIKLSITLILDQKIEQSIKESNDLITKKEIQEIHRKLSDKGKQEEN